MKQSSVLLYAVIYTLCIFILLPFARLAAQTNFVKFVGNPILPRGNLGEWDSGDVAFASVLFDDPDYHMWYCGNNNPTSRQRRIGYASSSDGINWNKHANDVVLDLGASGEFDQFSVWTPWVLFDGTHYEMWYAGDATGSYDLAIGCATATDPASWTKHSGNPILTKGNSGEWDQQLVLLPVVLHSDTLYRMWYSGRAANGKWQIGYATSIDGTTWSKHSGNPVLPVGTPGEWDAAGALASNIMFEDGQYQMWYHGDKSDDFLSIKIGFATSPNGITWTKHPGNPILTPDPGGWDSDNAWFPRVIKDGNRYRMWYSGRGVNIDRIGYAEDFSQAAHTDSIQAKMTAGSDTVRFYAYIANPHNENAIARALITSDGESVDSIDLTDTGNGIWQGTWVVPTEARDYSVGVELNNLSAGYLHNSFDWGVWGEFKNDGTTNVNANSIAPSVFTLEQNYPNPFNPTTTINFYLPKAEKVKIEILNVFGQRVRMLVNKKMPSGNHQITFNAKEFSSGIYFYKMTGSDFTKTRKMLLIK